MPNELANPPQALPASETPAPVGTPSPPESGPSREELIDALRAEQADKQAMAENFYRQGQRPALQPRGEDPLDRWVNEGLALQPADAKQTLDAAIRGRANDAAIRAASIADQRSEARMVQMQNEMALQSVFAQHPDLADPKNHPKFAAAMVEVDMEAKAAGINYNATQLTQRAAQKYRAANAPTSPSPAYVEGSSAGGMPPTTPNSEPEPSILEEIYGMPTGTIQPMPKSMDEETGRFIKEKNAEMFGKGVRSNMPRVMDAKS